jgi:hypothetical protein
MERLLQLNTWLCSPIFLGRKMRQWLDFFIEPYRGPPQSLTYFFLHTGVNVSCKASSRSFVKKRKKKKKSLVLKAEDSDLWGVCKKQIFSRNEEERLLQWRQWQCSWESDKSVLSQLYSHHFSLVFSYPFVWEWDGIRVYWSFWV